MTDHHDGDDPGVAQRAFDLIASAQKVGTIPELNTLLKPMLAKIGFDHFLGATAKHTPKGVDVEILFGANHEAWEAHYQSKGYAQQDAVLKEMWATGEPLFWTDLEQRRPAVAKNNPVLQEAREFGFRNGFGTPLLHLDGSVSTVLLMGEHVDHRDPHVRSAAHLVSIYYGSIGRRLLRQFGGVPPHLSLRELECLKWVRAGKSSNDIGQILNLSQHTVNDYIASACARLGVRTRVQAVAEAAIHGLIEL